MFDRLNKALTIVIKLFVIIFFVAAALELGLSVYASIAMKHAQAVTAVPEFPAASQAHFVFLIKATGETILSNNEVTQGPGKYLLHGYYDLKYRAWVFHKTDLPLDEKYFGPIEMIER